MVWWEKCSHVSFGEWCYVICLRINTWLSSRPRGLVVICFLLRLLRLYYRYGQAALRGMTLQTTATPITTRQERVFFAILACQPGVGFDFDRMAHEWNMRLTAMIVASSCGLGPADIHRDLAPKTSAHLRAYGETIRDRQLIRRTFEGMGADQEALWRALRTALQDYYTNNDTSALAPFPSPAPAPPSEEAVQRLVDTCFPPIPPIPVPIVQIGQPVRKKRSPGFCTQCNRAMKGHPRFTEGTCAYVSRRVEPPAGQPAILPARTSVSVPASTAVEDAPPSTDVEDDLARFMNQT